MNKKSFRPCFINFLLLLVLCLLANSPIDAQQISNSDKVLSELFETYNRAKSLCGDRSEAIRIGKKIIELYPSNGDDSSISSFIIKDIPAIEVADRVCRRNKRYDDDYKNKNWNDFFLVSKEIIAEEGDNPLALDVILTLVSVGFDRASVDKDDTFNSDTLYYANLAIQRIEAEQKSRTGKWGVFEPFNQKDNAIKWMNYMIGWFSFYKLNQKKESLQYFYKAIQYKEDNYLDSKIYLLIGDLYSDELFRSFNAHYEKDVDAKKQYTLQKAYAERALIAYAKVYKMEKNVALNSPYKKMENLYKFRFNLPANENPDGLNQFIPQLIIQPLPKLTDPLEPIFEDPTKIKIHQNKAQ